MVIHARALRPMRTTVPLGKGLVGLWVSQGEMGVGLERVCVELHRLGEASESEGDETWRECPPRGGRSSRLANR